MITSISKKFKHLGFLSRNLTSKSNESPKFEAVYSFPFIKYISLYNRLKVYHLFGSSVAVPSSVVLEICNILPEKSYIPATYIAVSGMAVLSLASLPLKNIIGFLYISEDNQYIKISSVDFWGKRVDRVIPAKNWVPLFDIGPKKTDVLYLSPQLSDKTQYKLFLKYGHVLNSKKVVEVLE